MDNLSFDQFLKESAIRPLLAFQFQSQKDDNTKISKITFGILATLTSLLLAFSFYNGLLLLKTGRLKRNIPLALFQVFTLFTLGTLWLCFMDCLFDYQDCPFNIFMTLPAYAYASMGYCYMMNCVKVVFKDSNNDKQGNPKRRIIRRACYVIASAIVIGFTTYFLTDMYNQCNNILAQSHAVINITAMYFLTFLLMMTMSYMQWKKIKSVKKTQQYQRRKHQLVTIAFGVSYLVRGTYDLLQAIMGNKMITDFKEYGGEMNIAWSIFLFVFHMLGELVPITIILMYQYKSNIICLKNKQKMELEEYWCGAQNNNAGGGSNADHSNAKTGQEFEVFEDENDDEDSYYNEYEGKGCADDYRSNPRISDDMTSTAEYRHGSKKGKRKLSSPSQKKNSNNHQVLIVDPDTQRSALEHNVDELRAFSQYSFEPYDNANNNQSGIFHGKNDPSLAYGANRENNRGRFGNDHSLVVTETGTGLRVSMLPTNNDVPAHKDNHDSSLLAPSSGNNPNRELLLGLGTATGHDLYSENSRNFDKKGSTKKNSIMDSLRKITGFGQSDYKKQGQINNTPSLQPIESPHFLKRQGTYTNSEASSKSHKEQQPQTNTKQVGVPYLQESIQQRNSEFTGNPAFLEGNINHSSSMINPNLTKSGNAE